MCVVDFEKLLKTGQKECFDEHKAEFLKDVEKMLDEKYGMKIAGNYFEVGQRVYLKNDYDHGPLILKARSRGVVERTDFLFGQRKVVVRFEECINTISFEETYDHPSLSEWLVKSW